MHDKYGALAQGHIVVVYPKALEVYTDGSASPPKHDIESIRFHYSSIRGVLVCSTEIGIFY